MDDHREIEAVLKPLLAPDAVLCSNGGGKGPIDLAAREIGVVHRAVNLSKGIRVLAGAYHFQNANAYHFAPEGMDATVPWCGDIVSGPPWSGIAWTRPLESISTLLCGRLYPSVAMNCSKKWRATRKRREALFHLHSEGAEPGIPSPVVYRCMRLW